MRNGQILKPLLIGTEGMTNTGKTEFLLSCPGLLQLVSIDRGFSAVFDNPNPPEERNNDVAMLVVQAKGISAGDIKEYAEYFKQIRTGFYSALDNPDSTVVGVDTDSDFWELHILAHFGKTTQIFPQTRYAAPYAEKRAIIARAWDSGKIVIGTNKVRDEYESVYNEDGTPKLDNQGQQERRKTGGKTRQGFPDQDYLWDIQLRHLYQAPCQRKIGKQLVDVPPTWGIEILKCKHRPETIGSQLWGPDCNFRGLVTFLYPDVPLERWGF